MAMLALSLLLSAAALGAQNGAALADSYKKLLPEARAYESDLGVRPSRWETPLTEGGIEWVLDHPLDLAIGLHSLDQSFNGSLDSEALLSSAGRLVGQNEAANPPEKPLPLQCDGLDPSLRAPLEKLVAALALAKADVTRSIAGLDNLQRERLDAVFGGVLINDPFQRVDASLFDDAAKFDRASALQAAQEAAAGVEEALPELRANASAAPKAKLRCTSSAGDVLLGTTGDDSYAPEELSSSLLVVDFGGSNHYLGGAAVAGAGDVRVVIDLGSGASVQSEGATAGSGRFGLGLFYSMGAGTTTIKGGDFSAGAGLFGVGGAFIAGPSVVDTLSYGQGAGAFGAGLLELRGPATATARYGAEGFGFTRGEGIFLARQAVDARCGLYFPDPREDLAWESLCQGVGFGPRAFAGGGWGVARLDGDGSRLEASYFAQGAGYWHGLGALLVHGNRTFLKARRYSQGTGVHTAVGALELYGDGIETVNWGVGPGFGWDYGIGWLDADGHGQRLRSDWAAGRADLNSRSFVHIGGDSAVLSLHDLGTGSYARAGAGYSLVDIEGPGHRLQASDMTLPVRTVDDDALNPWAVIWDPSDLALDPTIRTSTVSWPTGDRQTAAKREGVELDERLARVDTMPAPQRVAELLFIVSRFGLAGDAVGRAIQKLEQTPEGEASALVAALSPERFDELMWIRVLTSALGRPAAQSAAGQILSATGLRRALLVGLLGSGPIDLALDPALAELRSDDWRVRKQAAGVVGSLFDVSRTQEPGRLAFLSDSLDLLSGSLKDSDFYAKAGDQHLTDLYAALALTGHLTVPYRVALLEKAGSPFDSVKPEALQLYAKLLRAFQADAVQALKNELSNADLRRRSARAALADAAHDAEPEVAAAALLSLARIGSAEDLPILRDALQAPTSLERDAAAYGLALLGKPAGSVIDNAFTSGSVSQAEQAVLAGAQSTDADVMLQTLKKGLADPRVEIRRMALASLSVVQTPLLPKRALLVVDLQRVSRSDPAAGLQTSAAQWLRRIAPQLQ